MQILKAKKIFQNMYNLSLTLLVIYLQFSHYIHDIEPFNYVKILIQMNMV